MDNCLRFVYSSCVMMVFVMEFLRSNMSRSHVVNVVFLFFVFLDSGLPLGIITYYYIYIYIHDIFTNSPVYSAIKKKQRLDFIHLGNSKKTTL